MPNLTRRSFLATATAAMAAAGLRAQPSPASHASLILPARASGSQIPKDFLGLSYESEQLADPTFFSVANHGLIGQFRALGDRGVLRIGGNTSENSWWNPTARSPIPQQPHFYPVVEEAVNNLSAFLDATGWTCIYGVNFDNSTPERAAREADYVAKTLGKRLEYLQVGNEVDLSKPSFLKGGSWNPQRYLEHWLKFAQAISAAVPGMKFGMPDIAGQLQWLTEIAELWPTIQNPPQIVSLTHHYYFGGPATNPNVNIHNLLSPATAAKVQGMADVAREAAAEMSVPLRMTEGNTCYRGGKPGVSDVFASALWAADYALHLAANGYRGVNLHGGSGPSVANSVGGSLPGDTLLRDNGETPAEIATHPHPFYTPIASFGSEYVLEPVAYGLKFAGQMTEGTLFDGNMSGQLLAADVNATGYAAMMPNGDLKVMILNKDADQDLSVDLDCGSQRSGVVEMTALHAPALDSRTALIDPASPFGHLSQGRCTMTVPHACGRCFLFRRT